MKVIHLEDSTLDAEMIQHILREHWPECEIQTLNTRGAFEFAIEHAEFDVILSDYTLPGYDGLAALEFVRLRHPEKPFIYISGTIGEERAIEALKAGANDYVIKDRPARLVTAIRLAMSHVEQSRAQKRAEEKIREQASLLDKAHEAICVADARRRITYINASAERLYGISAGEALGKDVRELLYAGDHVRFDAAYATLMEAGEWRGELSPETSSEETVILECSWSLVKDATGSATSMLMIDADVTERRKIATQLMRGQRLETLGLLAGGIAHDLNNVLAPIITSVDLLRMHATHEDDLETLVALEESAQHGAELVRQLLAFARGNEGQKIETRVDALIGSVSRLLQRTIPSMVELKTEMDEALWMLHADTTQLRQIFLNLCINARDAMPEGGTILIRATNAQVDPAIMESVFGEPKAGPYVCISVSDTGTGIPQEIVGKIFDPFFTTKAAGKGTGLGLATVGGIVKAHGGFLGLKSAPGRGTTFHIYLPALEKTNGDSETHVPMGSPLHGHGESILVIEDDDDIRAVLEVLLTTRGYRVELAADGAEGLAHVLANPGKVDLVLADLNMPGISGSEVVRRVADMEHTPAIVAMSGLSREQQEDAEGLELIEILAKPITVETLLETVRRALEARRARNP